MNALQPDSGSAHSRSFAWWALGVWVVLLLAMLGAIQYLRRADFVYLAAAVGVLVVCAGCILRQGWARPAMRALCVALVSAPLIIFVPSKDTMYMMLGIRTTDAVLNTDTGKKLQEIIQKKLDGYLLELDKPKK